TVRGSWRSKWPRSVSSATTYLASPCSVRTAEPAPRPAQPRNSSHLPPHLGHRPVPLTPGGFFFSASLHYPVRPFGRLSGVFMGVSARAGSHLLSGLPEPISTE